MIDIQSLDQQQLNLVLSEMGLKGVQITQGQYEQQTKAAVAIVDVKSHTDSAVTEIKIMQQRLSQWQSTPPLILAIVDVVDSEKTQLFRLGVFDYISSPLIVAEFKNRLKHALYQYDLAQVVAQQLNAATQAEPFDLGLCDQVDFLLADKTAQYLTRQLANEVSLNDLVRHMGTNKNKLRNAFKACFGTTLFNWLAEQRLAHAALLLETTSQSILQIAGQVGYPDSNNFATAFKRAYGLSPSEYRQSLQNTQPLTKVPSTKNVVL